jgi:hypothetical protein
MKTKQITTLGDVVAFAKELIGEGTNFHCDDDFNDYINLQTKKPAYTQEEAGFRNELMQQCFIVCEANDVDIYEVMSESAFSL